MYVNGIGFLTSIGYPLYYRKTQHVSDGKTETLYKALDKILRIYNSRGFWVDTINCDNGFRVMMDDVKDELDCNMCYTNAQDHEPGAEQNNRTIKNQVRVGLHRSTYRTMPRTMLQHLIITSTEKLNNFPATKRRVRPL